MTELNFATGVETFRINGGTEVTFNPTDSGFVEKLFNAFDMLDKKQEDYKAEVGKVGDNREMFALAQKRDAEMREIIDGILGAGVSTGLFGGMNVYAMADGLPVWCNLFLAIMEEVDTTFAQEQKIINPRISKYTKKYHK